MQRTENSIRTNLGKRFAILCFTVASIFLFLAITHWNSTSATSVPQEISNTGLNTSDADSIIHTDYVALIFPAIMIACGVWAWRSKRVNYLDKKGNFVDEKA